MTAEIEPITSAELVICPRCGGRGKRERKELVDIHRGDYASTIEPCSPCRGTGRVMKFTHITFEPFFSK